MTKFLRRAALMVALAGGSASLVSVTMTDTVAQEKGTKKDKMEKEKAGKFVVSEGKDKMFRFSVYDGEGKFLANSGANKFATLEDAKKGVEKFKATVKDAKIEVSDEKEEKTETKEKKKPAE